jgi:hypothetical protein
MKCDKCGYDDRGTGDFAHVCGPVAVKTPIGGSGLPQDVHRELTDFIASVGGRYEFKYGSTAAFWDMAWALAQHIGQPKE